MLRPDLEPLMVPRPKVSAGPRIPRPLITSRERFSRGWACPESSEMSRQPRASWRRRKPWIRNIEMRLRSRGDADRQSEHEQEKSAYACGKLGP